MTRRWRMGWLLLVAAWAPPAATWAAPAVGKTAPTAVAQAAPSASAAEPAGVSSAEARAVRGVVQAQLAAFAADDAGGAFALAAPKIRALFGTADRFIAMVRTHYPVVYRPATVEFLLPTRIDGELIQAVRLSDGRGALWLAVYRMERQADKSWRIGGCELAETQGRAT